MTRSRALFSLLAVRRFLPLFITQLLGAANDNVLKTALAALITYRIGESAGVSPAILVNATAGMLILPFFLFSATAGQLADKYDKALLIRRLKLAELVLMVLAAIGLVQGWTWYLLGVLFLMGTQSAFFGPLKYAVLPEHLDTDELVTGNALVESGTFLAILAGTIVGGTVVLHESFGLTATALVLVGLAAIGVIASLFIPATRQAVPDLVISRNIAAETWSVIRRTTERRDVFLSILGISWFWLVGATFLAQFLPYAKEELHGDQSVFLTFLVTFSVGVGLGSLICGRLLRGEISARYVPFAALGMTVFSVDLWLATSAVVVPPGELIGLTAFLAEPANARILLDLLAISVCGGIYIVPLYAIMQSRSDDQVRARIIAGNNILNALFMVVSALVAGILLASGFTVTDIFLTVAIANAAVAVYICNLLPDAVLKGLFTSLFRLAYRVEVRGLENYPPPDERTVIVVNHVSFLDAALLAALLPDKPTFAINTQMARRWWVRPFLRVVDAFPLDPTNPLATKALIKAVREGRRCVIFPEGRITVTGALMKVYEGPAMIADKADAKVLPVRIDGAQYSPFSRLKGKVRPHLFPKITVTILKARTFQVPDGAVGRVRRQAAGLALYDLMSEMMFATCACERTLFTAILDAASVHGADAVVIEDIERRPLSYGRLVIGSLVLGRVLKDLAAPDKPVGVLLPNAAGAAVTFFGLQAFGRVPAMLNFSTGAANMAAACTAARVEVIVTSRRFITAARLESVVKVLAEQARIVYLEDVRAGIGALARLRGLIERPFAGMIHRRAGTRADDAAVILFTSGSEGTPKGVVLSHRNLLSNCHQLGARIDFNPSDLVFNALPIFHSFGLTGGMILPMISGIRTFLYPSPLHYRIVPEVVYDIGATIMFGTDTFLSGYARVANPYDFYSIRYIFAGAEKVREDTRRTWMEKFGKRVLEGYGATETAPVIATNTAMHYRAGTVGRILPGIRWRLDPVPGIDTGGRLVVAGPNVMLGYLRVDNPGVLEPPPEGWYDTGDIVSIDAQGFVTIEGRAKRFAKIAGEMVSLGAAEALAAEVWPGHRHAVVTIPDARKGEQLVLVTDTPDAARDALLVQARARGIAELLVPKTVIVVETVPVLGTGKTDHIGAKAIAVQRM